MSSAGIDMLVSWERFVPTPYKDAVGIWTIGVGHAMPNGITIHGVTLDRGKALLEDLAPCNRAVFSAVPDGLSQTEFDALVHFTFNVGVSAFLGSTLLRKLKGGDRAGAAAEFARWKKAGGPVVAGLVRRRAAESALFQCGTYLHNG
ncbi:MULTISPECIES: lysozyme [unclassified Caballeronia]|uniref:lysozyme n=1 Tax=unclassified Caballeronia TaxID=2646786 RepID=UPI002857412E|nr:MULTISPECIES: lysozyme [unclassified Caballeronia]MDR5750200.1 lysozyme [Caballeronia sp. LZ024]MDR5842671.1 lysozyme [Caballeronia sp. LZ031]